MPLVYIHDSSSALQLAASSAVCRVCAILSISSKNGRAPAGQRGYFLLVVGFFVLFYFNFFVVVCFNVILLTRIAAVKWLIVNIHLLSECVHMSSCAS